MQCATFTLPGGFQINVRGPDPHDGSRHVVITDAAGNELPRAAYPDTDGGHALAELQATVERFGLVRNWTPELGYDAPDDDVVEHARAAIAAHKYDENRRPARITANRKAEAK